MTSEERMVIFASSLGTVFEWYDFYIYGTLAPILAAQFFSGVNPTAAFIFTLLAFAAGFAVRPFGALFFGRLGDLIGRKYTFLITMTLMGLGTFFIGVLPSYAAAGIIAPVILIGLRWRKASRSAANMAAPRSTSPNTPRRTSAATTPPGSRPRRPSVCSWRCCSCSASAQSGRTDLRRLGLAHSVPALGHPARGFDLDPAQAAGIAAVRAHEGRRQGLRIARCRKPSANGPTPRSRSSRCSARPPARRWSGTADSSMRCSSCC